MPSARSRAALDDRRLARRLRRREADALREVYERFGRTTYGFLVHMLRDPASAEDVQIAAETGIPLGTVKWRMVNGLKQLRKLIEDEDG